jgi:type II secretory pathway component PulF
MFNNQYMATVRNEAQQIAKRLVSARTLEAAVSQLITQKYSVLEIEMRPNPFLLALAKGRIAIGSPASKRDLATFSSNLALMGLIRRKAICYINASNSTASVL